MCRFRLDPGSKTISEASLTCLCNQRICLCNQRICLCNQRITDSKLDSTEDPKKFVIAGQMSVHESLSGCSNVGLQVHVGYSLSDHFRKLLRLIQASPRGDSNHDIDQRKQMCMVSVVDLK
ncbi:hypothetical protein AVEN_128020-1 [Araneus ventricosus]|uniref:Uncharacterized protein n=1 Tax=Araneus ventricosus TaxID=182803 RepID=A0A4Y1ZZ88_ARAVE|nr:hypothetical protein AVEN_128020-1 [Araneus ventricosus]